MNIREQLIEAKEGTLSPLELKADRRRQRVRKIIIDAREQDIERVREDVPARHKGEGE